MKGAIVVSRANLSGAILREADLSGAYLREADLSETNVGGANLMAMECGPLECSGSRIAGQSGVNSLVSSPTYAIHIPTG